MNILYKAFKKYWINRDSERLLNYYRKRGIKIGRNTIAFHPGSLRIDDTRPSLVEIGEHVFLHKGLSILSHDYTSWVFINLYNDFIPSHGRVKIGNNVWFGENCTVLKNVEIGDNCIIGLGSVVSKDIPSGSVAAGVPAKIICSIHEYYEKRKKNYTGEAIEYAKSIKEKWHRAPVIDDFSDDYPVFVDATNIEDYPGYPYLKVFNEKNLEEWKKHHKASFSGFTDFMNYISNNEK